MNESITQHSPASSSAAGENGSQAARSRRAARERLVADLLAAVRGVPGGTAPGERDLAIAVGRARSAGAPSASAVASLGAAAPLVEAVADRANDVPVELVQNALAGGRDEREVFELIVAAAVGAGLARRERGLAAIDERPSAAGGSEARA